MYETKSAMYGKENNNLKQPTAFKILLLCFVGYRLTAAFLIPFTYAVIIISLPEKKAETQRKEMVSNNPNPSERGGRGFYLDHIHSGMEEEEEGTSKKTRKPYTITKSRESWTEPEHDKFLEALQLFDRDWKKIEAFVGSKTVIQIRSHAQKYFLKVQKSGASEHLPPPRPKRKAAHPYPQKASKNDPVLSQVSGSFQSSTALHEPGYILKHDSSEMPKTPIINNVVPSWSNNTLQTANVFHGQKVNNCSSSNESTPRALRVHQSNNGQGKYSHPLRVLPDFTQVYSFIGSVFDPNTTGHLLKLKKMDPIDVETVLLLMRNLSLNLTSPDFEHHRRLLASYEAEPETDNYIYINR
ncbi:hypothetical protein RIF29_23621 [Crotalaria pallida]|uniref:Uncharacterized protein n=1 Tax=Crotalaria pallida TaxID=3830 RepID=A0AAN9F5S1_CROPI